MEKEKKTNTEGGLKESEMTVYESSFIFLPSLAYEQVSSSVTAIKEAVSKLDGEVISYEDPILIDLAYPITKVVQTVRHKVQSGYFGWIKFEISAEKLSQIKKILDENDSIARYLIIKTVRENTLLNGRMILKKEERIKKEKEKEEQAIASEEASTPEEIDKSIDDLVIS